MGSFDDRGGNPKGPPFVERGSIRVDVAIARLAHTQHGVVSHGQLTRVGLSPRAIAGRVRAGRLHRLHIGVYAVGHTVLRPEGFWLAAVLSCGPDALLSHRHAAALWELRGTQRSRIDISAPRTRKPRPGVQVHRIRRLDPADRTVRHGIAVTTVHRTLVDLAEVLSPDELERAVHQADLLQLLDLRVAAGAIERANGRRGLGTLRRTLGLSDVALTRSGLERRFLALCRAAGLPRPRVNATVWTGATSYEVDFLWAEQRLVIETDGGTVHRTRRAFEQDRVRDADLTLAGYTVVRFTWRRVIEEPAAVADILARLLSMRSGPR